MKKMLPVLLLCFAFVGCNQQGVTSDNQNQSSSKTSIFTPDQNEDDMQDWEIFADSTKSAKFSYPTDWSEDLEWHVLHFTVNGEKYNFGFYEGSGLEFDSEKSGLATFGGQPFARTEYIRGGKTFLVTYQSIGTWIGSDGIQGEVPAENSEYYLSLFDKIMSTIQIEKK